MANQKRVTFREYSEHDDGQLIEWFDGEMRVLPALSRAQRAIRQRLIETLGGYVEMNEMGLLIEAPFAVRMPDEINHGREPDLVYVPNEFAETVRANYVNSHGVALAIEISDARSRELDNVEKFDEYEKAGIPEYWIFDADRRQARFYVMEGQRYVRAEPVEGAYHTRAVPGLAIEVARIFAGGDEAR